MRQKKFRQWDEELQAMSEPFSIGHICKYKGVHFKSYNPDKPTMQFTGLPDKNEGEICESDIVRFHYFYGSVGRGFGFEEAEHSLIGVVEDGKYGWGLRAIKGAHWEGYSGFDAGEGDASFMELTMMNDSGIHEESFEKLGNIYENPELLTA